MNNTRVIQTSKNPDLITYKVLIEGEELSRAYQIQQISVKKEVNRIPTATIVFLDGDVPAEDFPLSNEDLLVPGKSIEISAGYHSDEETIFKGMIIKHSIKIRSTSSLLIVECKDEAVKLTVGRKSSYYYESTDADIIEEIIDKYGIDHQVEATNVSHKELVQYNCSDWDFTIARAQANGKLCYIDDGKIVVESPDLSQDTVETVTYGATLLDFDAEIDSRHQFNSVASFGWSHADQEGIEVEGNNPSVAINGNLSSTDLADVIGVEKLELKHGGKTTEPELQEWADAKFKFQQMAQVRGRARFQGIPLVRPGKMIELQGVGDRFNGKVFISGVRHLITEGNWTVDVQFGLNPEWFSETFEISPQPAAGLLSAVPGLQIGVVSQLQDDPDGEDRILVKFPIVNHEEQGIWCRIATLDAGENRGSFFRPEISDEVIVGFINDDPNEAVILGMLNSSAKPAPIQASDDNHEKGFVTRSEMKVLFNDDKKAINIETPAGKKIVIDEDAGSMVIEDENSNVMTFDSNGITVESPKDIAIKASGDVNIEGMNVNIKANANLTAEGGANAEVSAGAIAVLKGSLVQIN